MTRRRKRQYPVEFENIEAEVLQNLDPSYRTEIERELVRLEHLSPTVPSPTLSRLLSKLGEEGTK